jgi:GTP cyclohydrolase I
MPDIQSASDDRNLAIQRVGVRQVKHPLLVKDSHHPAQHTVGTIDLYVGLDADKKGAHMSRFFELLGTEPLTVGTRDMSCILDDMMTRLASHSAEISADFTLFLPKAAPVSKVHSLLDYRVTLLASCNKTVGVTSTLKVTVPVTSLCPCSKAISQYGAHNQRSHIILECRYDMSNAPSIVDLITLAESEASCALYGLLKRPDEKYVTEYAYDNPKFVEDLVRDVARGCAKLPGVTAFRVSSENFESIHNHSAYAQIEHNWA